MRNVLPTHHSHNTALMFTRPFEQLQKAADSTPPSIQTLYRTHRYHFKMDEEVGIVVVSPVFFGHKLEVDLYDIVSPGNLASSPDGLADPSSAHQHNWHPILWAGEESLTEDTLDLLSQLSAHFFQVVLKPGERSFNSASVGTFRRFTGDPHRLQAFVKAANTNKEFAYNYKNYFVLPVPPTHFRDVAKISVKQLVEALREDFREALELSHGLHNPFFDWKKYIFDVGGSSAIDDGEISGPSKSAEFRADPRELGFHFPQSSPALNRSLIPSVANEATGRNFMVVHPEVVLSKTTLGAFIEIIAESSYRVGKSSSPSEFQKWFFTDKSIVAYRSQPLAALVRASTSLYSLDKVPEEWRNFLALDKICHDNKECAHFLAPLSLLLSQLRGGQPEKQTPEQWNSYIDAVAEIHFALAFRIPCVREIPDYNDRNRVNQSKDGKLDFWERLRLYRLQAGELHLIQAEWLGLTALMAEGYNRYQRGLSMLVNFERLAQIVELSATLDLNYIPLRGLYTVFQNSSADQEFNYEALETVGDSVLKFIVSLHLFTTNPGPEGELTVRKNKIVQNETLGKAGMAVGLHLGIRLHKQKNQFVIPSSFSLDIEKMLAKEQEIKHRYAQEKSKKTTNYWSQKNELDVTTKLFLTQDASLDTVADVVEALIGAAFTQDYRLSSALLTIKRLGVLPDFDFQSFEEAFQTSILIPQKILEPYLNQKETILERSSNRSLYQFGFGDAQTPGPDFLGINSSRREILAAKKDARDFQLSRLKAAREFQKDSLNYVFENQYWFDQATDFSSNQFQRLEFFGDSVLEVYLIANLHNIFNCLGLRISPEYLTRAKAWLVSSHNLCRMAALAGLADCLVTVGETGANILKFLAKFNTNTRVEPEMASFEQKVASLEDALEALIGALFLDGSWEAVHAFLTPRFIGYLVYFANFHQKMGTDLRGDIQRHFDLHGKKLHYLYQPQGNVHTYKTFLSSDPKIYEPKDLYEQSSGPDKKEAENALMRKIKDRILRTYKGGLGSS